MVEFFTAQIRNPNTHLASVVRRPRHSVRKGDTPVLAAEEARALLDAIDTSTPMGLRDRALIALMVYTFARVGAVLKMRLEDVYVQGRRTWVRLHEKGGKEHAMPCHHNLEEYLHAYVDGAQLAGAKGWLFRSGKGRTQIGRASCRGRAEISVVAVSLKKNKQR